MTDTLVSVEGLYKKFTKSLRKSLVYGSIDMAKSMIGVAAKQEQLRNGEFWALQDINFELKRGETLGLIGQNGCGKSTLLRMINGIFPPDHGKITINGRIGALIAVGAGFHPHMSGKENIFLNGTILGMSKNDIKRRYDEIVSFAEIGDFLEAPVATYSSGMTVRLGFAIAINCEPDILLIDEILAVGDSKFQRKCLDKLRDLRNQGTATILVSHNVQNIEAICNKAVLLDHGVKLLGGSPKDVVPVYELLLKTGKAIDFDKELDQKGEGLLLVKKYRGFGTDEIEVDKVLLKDKHLIEKFNFSSEEELNIEIQIDSKKIIKGAKIWLSFTYMQRPYDEEKNIVCLGTRKVQNIEKGKSILKYRFPNINLTTGEYKIEFYIFDETFSNPYFQGQFGYFYVKHEIPSNLTPGKDTPYVWNTPNLIIE